MFQEGIELDSRDPQPGLWKVVWAHGCCRVFPFDGDYLLTHEARSHLYEVAYLLLPIQPVNAPVSASISAGVR